MTTPARPAPFFLAEDPALDFLNSVASPWGSRIEWIGSGGDLLDWLELADLVPLPVLKRYRRGAARDELDTIAARARELREWFREFVADHAGRPLPSTALIELRTINHLLARDDTYRQLEALKPANTDDETNGRALRWKQNRRWGSSEMLLLPLAEAMGNLVCRSDLARVKKCEGPTCTMWFHDVSQNHTRRWCSMAVCGNRAKAAAHRARRRAAR